MRRTPIGFEKEEEENLTLMLETGVISESSSDWASAPVLVRKKDWSVRYCVDFRCLNDKTVKDLFPLPSISQCLDQLSGNMFFSTLDMNKIGIRQHLLPSLGCLSTKEWPLVYVTPQLLFKE